MKAKPLKNESGFPKEPTKKRETWIQRVVWCQKQRETGGESKGKWIKLWKIGTKILQIRVAERTGESATDMILFFAFKEYKLAVLICFLASLFGGDWRSEHENDGGLVA